MTYQDNDPGHTNAHNDHLNQIAAVQASVVTKADAGHGHGQDSVTNLVTDLANITSRISALETQGIAVPIAESDVLNLTSDLAALDSRADALEAVTLSARKTADTSRTSNAVLADDPDLKVTVAANTAYVVEAFLIYEGATTGDLQVAFTIPAGASLTWSPRGLGPSTSSGTDSVRQLVNTGGSSPMGALGAGQRVASHPVGLLVVGGTAGDFTLQWAQNTSDATATILGAGSWLRLSKE